MIDDTAIIMHTETKTMPAIFISIVSSYSEESIRAGVAR